MKLRLPLKLALLLLGSLSFSVKAEDYYWVSTAGDAVATGGDVGWFVKDTEGGWNTVKTGTEDWGDGKTNIIHIDKAAIDAATPNPGSVIKDLKITFFPLALGGFSVNVEGFSFTAGGSFERGIQLNAVEGQTSCDFVIGESFSINSQAADKELYMALNADWNVNIAGGKTLTLDTKLAMMRGVTGKHINVIGADPGNRARFILKRAAVAKDQDAAGNMNVSALSADWNITNAELVLNVAGTLGTGSISGNNAQLTFNAQDTLANAIEVGESGLTIMSSGLTLNGSLSGAGDLVISAHSGAPSMQNVLLQSVDNSFTGGIKLSGLINLVVNNTSGQAFAESVGIDISANSQMHIGVGYVDANHFEMGNLSGAGSISGNYDGYDEQQARYMRLNQTEDTVFSGVVVAETRGRAINIAKAGDSTLTLTGDSLGNGTLTIESGAIQLGAGEASGSWKGNIVFDAEEGKTPQLIINHQDGFNFDKSISGNGMLVIDGGGKTTLSGQNTHTLGTSINAGKTLLVASDTALGSGGLSMYDGSVFAAQGAAALNMSKQIKVEEGVATIGEKAGNTGTVIIRGGVEFFDGSSLRLVAAEIASSLTGSGILMVGDGSSVLMSAGGFASQDVHLFLGSGSHLLLGGGLDSQTAGVLSFGEGSVMDFSSFEKTFTFTSYTKDMGTLNLTGYTPTVYGYLKIDNEEVYEKLTTITINGMEAMLDGRGRLVEYSDIPEQQYLVASGYNPLPGTDGHYTYSSNSVFYGAAAGENVDFTESFLFEAGADMYGFTTQDMDENTSAGGFTVSSKLEGDRSLYLKGQGAAGRAVVLTNTENNYSGGTLVDSATLRLQAKPGSSFDHANVTLLGVASPDAAVRLVNQAVLELATGEASYTYANHFQLNNGGGVISQLSGAHTLTGSITLNGDDTAKGTREIRNETTNDMILTGRVLSTGNNTLTLTTEVESSSRIIMNMREGSSVLNKLAINGNVELNSPAFTVNQGVSLGNNGKLSIASGTLRVGNEISSTLSSRMTFSNGTTLEAISDLTIGANVVVNLGSGKMFLNTRNHMVSFNGTIDSGTSSVFTKVGSGTLIFGKTFSTGADFSLNEGLTSLEKSVGVTTTGIVNVLGGSTLELNQGSFLSAGGLNVSGTLSGEGGSIQGGDLIRFREGSRYLASMSRQGWSAVFQSGSTMSGSLTNHTGNIVFEAGSRLLFNTDLPVDKHVSQISTTEGGTVAFKGVSVGGTTNTPEIDWDSTEVYEFKLVTSDNALLGKDGKVLSEGNMSDSVYVASEGWGAFLSAELALMDDSKTLVANIIRNSTNLSEFAQTGNQMQVAGTIDYIMDNFSQLGLRGTELGDIVQFFNKMGQDISVEAPEALGMIGGLSNYQALAGQRTDMMRHLEAVRQRANAGKGMADISSIPDNSFWVEGTQGYSRVDGTDSSSPGYTAKSWGAAIGMDYLSAKNYSLGVAFAYSDLTLDSNQYAGQTNAENYYVDLYGRWESGHWNGVVVLSGGVADVDVKRTMNLGSGSLQGRGSTDGTQIIGMTEVAYDWQWVEDGPTLQPYVGMAVGMSKLDGYTESGLGNAGLSIDEQKQNVVQGSLGVRLYKQNIDREMQYETSRWELRAGLVEEFGDTSFSTRSSFIGLPSHAMSTSSEDIGKTGFQMGAGFNYAVDSAWSVFGDVNGEFRTGQTSMNSTLGLRCTF